MSLLAQSTYICDPVTSLPRMQFQSRGPVRVSCSKGVEIGSKRKGPGGNWSSDAEAIRAHSENSLALQRDRIALPIVLTSGPRFRGKRELLHTVELASNTRSSLGKIIQPQTYRGGVFMSDGLEGKKDPKLNEREREWPFLEIQERMIRDSNKQILVDAEILLAQSNNKFGLVLEISDEANEYLRNNKEESLTRKPVLKVMSDRINQGAGENIRDSYIEETTDPTG